MQWKNLDGINSIIGKKSGHGRNCIVTFVFVVLFETFEQANIMFHFFISSYTWYNKDYFFPIWR